VDTPVLSQLRPQVRLERLYQTEANAR
jgi:hypothetical protein